MIKKNKLVIFQNKQIRRAWHNNQWYFSVIDVVGSLTDSKDPTDYFKKIRKRDKELGLYIGTKCPQVEMMTETGKKRRTLAGNFDMTPSEYKKFKNIPNRSKANLRDNMTDLELIFTMLGEKVTTEISKKEKPKGMPKNKKVARRGGTVAGNARKATEKELGKSVISRNNYLVQKQKKSFTKKNGE